ncbi:hypothetical protein ABTK96_19670, partial [Acinetobacter baumannii]
MSGLHTQRGGAASVSRRMARSGEPQREVRNLVLVLGDQLDLDSAAFDGFEASRDVVLQMEVMEETS